MTQASASGVPGKAADTAGLRPVQLAWLAGSIFIVSSGYGALLPVLPAWLNATMPGVSAAEVGRHVGFLSGVYAAGVLLGAPLWGLASDRLGRGRILVTGMVGYVASLLLLLLPQMAGLWPIYALRGTTGFFVAAVVPVVAALVAEHTPKEKRAQRFAWLGAMSLLGFLFGPALGAVAHQIGSRLSGATASALLSAQVVLVASALLGGVMMIGLAATVPASPAADAFKEAETLRAPLGHPAALLCLSGTVMFVLAGFELGLVLQGQQGGPSSRQAALMLAECSLVMLGVNALLFATSMLEKIPTRILMMAGLVLATVGLGVLAVDRSDVWMYLGVSLTSAGTGLVLPGIAFMAAGATPSKLGVVMGGLAASAGFGQTLGSAAGGWLFGAAAQRGFAWLALPLMAMTIVLVVRSEWWSAAITVPVSKSSHPRHEI